METLLKPKIKDLLNKSILSELYASNLYKHIANQLQRLGLFGSQKFFLKESAEELEHYQTIVNYVNDMGDVADMPQIPTMKDKVNSLSDAIEIAYETEVELMKHYQEAYELAEDSKDCITATFFIDFMQIQRKAVGQYGDLISRLKLNGDIYQFDKELGKL